MQLQVSLPSKSFLIGEYGVLAGSRALLLNTSPRFEFQIQIPGEGRGGGIHASSPAGFWMRRHPQWFRHVDVNFKDPFEGSGGFGASSAQFIGAWIYQQLQEESSKPVLRQLSEKKLWDDFRSVHEDQDLSPSGADVMAQYQGGVCEFSPDPWRVKNHPWPFKNLSFSLLKTAIKVNTYSHLANLKMERLKVLNESITEAFKSFGRADGDLFKASVREFQARLKSLDLLCEPSAQLIEEIQSLNSQIAIKGCGALGADVLLCLHSPDEKKWIAEVATAKNLKLVATEDDLSSGVEVKWRPLAAKVTEYEL